MAAERRYAAFISYSHSDEKLASWLHRKLEAYGVPGPLVGRTTAHGVIGKRLGKVFRDRAELGADHDLGGEIRAALERSDALIVLCSPRSAKSTYVNEEVRYFKSLGRGDRIMAAIAEGEPHAAGKTVGQRVLSADDECFPPALLHQLGGDGAVSQIPETQEPIAADFRRGKDEHEGGKLKLIAGLLSVGLDDLIQRERVAQRWRMRGVAALAVVFAGLAVAAGGFAVLAERNAAEARLQAGRVTERLAAQQVRAGDVGQGVDLLLGIAGQPQVVSLDRVQAIAAGLTPLSDVIAGVQTQTPFRWNGRAYVRGAEGLHDLGQFAPAVWTGDGRFIALMNQEDAIVVFDTQAGVVTARETAGSTFWACAVETRSNGISILGITQAGATLGGTSYSRWYIGEDGSAAFEFYESIEPPCAFGEISQAIQPVDSLNFPMARSETELWRAEAAPRTTAEWIEQNLAGATGLDGAALRLLFERGLESGADWYGVSGFSRGQGRFVMGIEDHGMAGESWAFCAANASGGGCRTFSYPLIAGTLGGVRVAPDGRAAVAFGFAFEMLDYTAGWAAQQREWRESDTAEYQEPRTTNGNLFMSSGGQFNGWSRPEALNSIGRIRDVAFSADSSTLALVTPDGLYTSALDGAAPVRTPFAIDGVELRGVAWRGNEVVILALSDLSLAAVSRDGALAWDRLSLASQFAPCDVAESYPDDYENAVWLAADPMSSLVVLGRGDCAIVVDSALGAPVTGLVRLAREGERAPLLFDRPQIRANGSGLELDFYWTRFARSGLSDGASFAALTGRVDGSLVQSLTALTPAR